MSQTIRMVVATRQRLLAEGVCVVVSTVPDLDVLAVVNDGGTSLDRALSLSPDILLVEEDLPGLEAPALCRKLKHANASLRVVVLVDTDDGAKLGRLVAAGVDGIVWVDVPLTSLVSVLRSVHGGELALPRRFVRPLIESLMWSQGGVDGSSAPRLSKREREVLGLLAEGCDTAAIAARLVVSPNTARTHIQNVIKKLGVHSRVEAVAFAAAVGIIDCGDRRRSSGV